jgi:putative selenium metabolism hydrolase
MLPLIEAIALLESQLGDHEFLGHGKITVTDMAVKTPSINAVPDECTIFIDRRMTFGETKESVLAQLQALIPAEHKASFKLEELFYDDPSYTGFVFPVDKYFPAWLFDETEPLVVAGKATREAIGYAPRPAGKWNFSTNGIYWAGKAGIPAIGFGPGEEETAHTVLDSVLLDDVVKATEFYTLLPAFLTAT